MAQLLGHNSSKTTEIYTHVSTKSPFMICSKKTIPSQLQTRNLCIFVAYINELAVSLETNTKSYDRQRIFKTIKNTDKRQSA